MRSRIVPSVLMMFSISVMIAAAPAAESSAVDQGSEVRRSNIAGRVVDAATREPLGNANVQVEDTDLGAVTDSSGGFTIGGVPVGNRLLRISYTGYDPLVLPNVVVRSGRTARVEAQLRMKTIEFEGLTVEGGHFYQAEEEPVSTVNFSQEEIRRAPGSAGDVSRIVMTLPSIAKVNDQVNGLIVRGGNPVENGFYLENMEIPNINHYPMQASSAGPIGLIKVDFLRDVNFSAGGYSAVHGNRLSSIMDLRFREGSREGFEGQLDFNMAGFGLAGEGPLAGGKGSWMLAGRKSYLDLIVDAIGTGVAPRYSDFQGKAVLDLSPESSISFLGVAGFDYIDFDKETALDDGDPEYGTAGYSEHLVGVNWSWRGGRRWHSETSLSHMYTDYNEAFSETDSDSLIVDNLSSERSVSLRNVTSYRLDSGRSFKFGLEAKFLDNGYETFLKAYQDQYGRIVPSLTIDRSVSSARVAGFLTYSWYPTPALELNPGLRVSHFTYNGNSHVEPRFSFRYSLTDRTAFTGAAGIYRQHLPVTILELNEDFKELRDPAARHFILGLSHLLTESTRLSLEVYEKQYRHFPMDPSKPALFPADEGTSHELIVDNGRAFARGVEMVLQKKAVEDFYGIMSASVYQSRYRGYYGVWRNRVFGNRYLFNIEGGYIASSRWEFSMRWVLAGGRPYTPYDREASRQARSGIYDLARINGERYPSYHSMNFRIDRRFNFSNSNLVMYWDLWNLYNRENIARYYWDEVENRQEESEQWSLIPIFGLEWEF